MKWVNQDIDNLKFDNTLTLPVTGFRLEGPLKCIILFNCSSFIIFYKKHNQKTTLPVSYCSTCTLSFLNQHVSLDEKYHDNALTNTGLTKM